MTFQSISDDLIHSLEHKFDRELASSHPLHESSPSLSPLIPDPSLTTGTASTSPPSGHFLSDLSCQPLTWLWPSRIPLGHLTLLDADPHCDPSLFALSLAASLSSGSPLPDGILPSTPATVLLYAPYDSASATLKPRLQAAGGDLAHLFLFRPSATSTHHPSPTGIPQTPSFTLPRNLPQLAATIRRLDARFVILDPASAIPGLSRSLPALADIAQQTNCAILLIRSLHQPVTDPLRSPGPSSPLLDAVRSRLLLIPDPQDVSHTLLLTTRHLLCLQSVVPILAYYNTCQSPDGLPTFAFLGNYDHSLLTRLCTGPLHSVHRQAILHFLHDSLTPQTISTILTSTCYDHEAGRKMLLRMKDAGELISPARGLYTIPNHPSFSKQTNAPSPVPNVPTIPNVPTSSHQSPLPPTIVPNVPTNSHQLSSAVPTVPNVPTIPNPPSPPHPTDIGGNSLPYPFPPASALPTPDYPIAIIPPTPFFHHRHPPSTSTTP